MSLSQGDRLGRYEILGPIGAGGMGEVWRARDTELDRQVAVKILPESFASDEDRLERFHREAKALAALTHPNLLEIYDVGSTDGIQYAVTELLEGDTLRERITPSGLPWKKVTSIGAAVADGLAAAHGRGIIHRDLKPENLFITADGRVKILDFGLASVHEEADADAETATITEAGTVMGTPSYMAPEQVKGKQADARSDIFSLGCVIYEMASGHRAFRGETGVEVIANILKEEPPQLSSSGASVPVDLERAVHRCLEKRPEARFQSAADLAYSLKSVGLSGTAPVMATPGSGIEAPAEKRFSLAQLGTAAVLVILAAIIVWRFLLPGGEQIPAAPTIDLDPNRIAVVPFTNRTGDASLDNLTSLTADRLTQGLADLDEIEVAPASVVAATSAGVDPSQLAREVAAGTRSGMVLTGVWDSVGNGLELQATLEDAESRTVVRAFDAISTGRDAPHEAISTLRDWTLMAVQDHLNSMLAWGAGDRFPKYEAYLMYRRFLENPAQGEGLSESIALDPDFVRPRLQVGGLCSPSIVQSLRNLMIEVYQPVHEMDLTNDQQRLVNMIDARLNGQWEDAYRIALEELRRDPEDPWKTQHVLMSANWANRPQAAIDTYQDLELGLLTPAARMSVVDDVIDALHRLERFDEEYALITETLEAGPAQTHGLPLQSAEIRALIALGRVREVDEIINEILLMPQSGMEDPLLIANASDWLRVYGQAEASKSMAERAVAWYEDNNPDVPKRLNYSRCLMRAGMTNAAKAIVDDLLLKFPDGQYVLTQAGVVAAVLGDRDRALEIEERLTSIDDSDLQTNGILGYHGVTLYRRARIATRLGDHDRALGLLQQAVTAGFNSYGLIQSEPDFEALWDDPQFQEILRPKG